MVCYNNGTIIEVATSSTTPLWDVLDTLKSEWGYEALTNAQMPEGQNTDITLPAKGNLQQQIYVIRDNVATPNIADYSA